jgi:hypothetical protein
LNCGAHDGKGSDGNGSAGCLEEISSVH